MQKFFAGEHAAFTKEAADLLLEVGIIKQIPDLTKLADTQLHQVMPGRAQGRPKPARTPSGGGAAYSPTRGLT